MPATIQFRIFVFPSPP